MSTPTEAQSVPPAGLSDGEWKSVQTQIRETEYHCTWHEPSVGFRALNRHHGWQTTFTARGAVVTPVADDLADDAVPWQWRMQLRGYGYTGAMQRVAPAMPTVAQNRVEYAWDETISEWWVNDPYGLEQGFTLHQRPDGACASCDLVVDLGLDTLLQTLEENGGLRFDDDADATVMRYNKLYVWDAGGRELPATMALAAGGVQLRVDDDNAVYPLTIDPILISEVAKLTASDAAGDDRFGWSVSISSDTLVVGAYRNDGAGDNSGAAYVFARNGGGADMWGQVAKLTASDRAGGDRFGWSVAISGDIIVVGAYLKDGVGIASGAAYVFARNGGGSADDWGEVAKLTASDAAARDEFGGSVAISGDTLVVGAHRNDDAGNGPDFDTNPMTLDVLMRDNNIAAVLANPAQLNVLEGGTADLGLKLSSQPSAPVTVSNNGTGAAAAAVNNAAGQQLTFDASNWDQEQVMTIQVPDNARANDTHEEEMALHVSSADAHFQAIGVTPVAVVVVDNDTAGIALAPTQLDLSEHGGEAHYEVTLTSQPRAELTITLITGDQLSVTPTQVVFTPDNWDQPQTVNVQAVDDAQVEPDGHVGLIRHTVASDDVAYNGIQVSDVGVAIEDNDVVGLTSNGADGLAVSEGGEGRSYGLKLSSRVRLAMSPLRSPAAVS